tara:strand:- start:3133 stop:3549 length:417 start_codon:yes stop_codon:yes gene_type:complete
METSEIIKHLSNTGLFGGYTLVTTEKTNQFEHFDATNWHYNVEIKSRDKKYDEWLIEKYKYEKNMEIAEDEKKMFVYVTEYDRVLYVWDLYAMKYLGKEIQWFSDRSMPNTTEFGDKGRRNKEVGYLPTNLCWFVIKV